MTDRFEFNDPDSEDPKSKKADSLPSFEKQLDWLDATEIPSDETNEPEGQAVPVRFSTKPKPKNSTLDYEIHTGIPDLSTAFARSVLFDGVEIHFDEKDEFIFAQQLKVMAKNSASIDIVLLVWNVILTFLLLIIILILLF